MQGSAQRTEIMIDGDDADRLHPIVDEFLNESRVYSVNPAFPKRFEVNQRHPMRVIELSRLLADAPWHGMPESIREFLERRCCQPRSPLCQFIPLRCLDRPRDVLVAGLRAKLVDGTVYEDPRPPRFTPTI